MSSENNVNALSKALVNYATAFLIWLFFIFVFIPLAREISSKPPLHSLLAFIALVSTLILVYSASESYLKAVSWVTEIAEKRRGRTYAIILKFAMLEILVLVDSILLVPITWIMAPALGGIVLIVSVIAAILVFTIHSSYIVEYILDRILG